MQMNRNLLLSLKPIPKHYSLTFNFSTGWAGITGCIICTILTLSFLKPFWLVSRVVRRHLCCLLPSVLQHLVAEWSLMSSLYLRPGNVLGGNNYGTIFKTGCQEKFKVSVHFYSLKPILFFKAFRAYDTTLLASCVLQRPTFIFLHLPDILTEYLHDILGRTNW